MLLVYVRLDYVILSSHIKAYLNINRHWVNNNKSSLIFLNLNAMSDIKSTPYTRTESSKPERVVFLVQFARISVANTPYI